MGVPGGQRLKPTARAAEALQAFLYENYGEMDVMVAIGGDEFHVYITRGKKHMKAIPEVWEGVAVERHWTGKVRPA